MGDENCYDLAPEDGYGDYDPEAFDEVPLNAFPSGEKLEPGMPVGVEDELGEMYEAFVS